MLSLIVEKKPRHFLSYLGGKHFMLKHLLPLLHPHRIYCEVFGGGAALLLAKEPSHTEVYNDLDGELVNLFMQVRDNPERFKERAESLLYSREIYYTFLRQLEAGEIADPVDRAVAFYYVVRNAFPSRWKGGWAFGRAPRQEPSCWLRTCENIPIVGARLRSVYIDHLDFRTCIKNWDSPDTLFFCDPPYLDVQGYRVGFTDRDHEDLRVVLGKIQGKFLLTYGDHPKILSLYQPFHIKKVDTMLATYGFTRSLPEAKRKQRPRYNHLIIANYDLSKTYKVPLQEMKLLDFL